MNITKQHVEYALAYALEKQANFGTILRAVSQAGRATAGGAGRAAGAAGRGVATAGRATAQTASRAAAATSQASSNASNYVAKTAPVVANRVATAVKAAPARMAGVKPGTFAQKPKTNTYNALTLAGMGPKYHAAVKLMTAGALTPPVKGWLDAGTGAYDSYVQKPSQEIADVLTATGFMTEDEKAKAMAQVPWHAARTASYMLPGVGNQATADQRGLAYEGIRAYAAGRPVAPASYLGTAARYSTPAGAITGNLMDAAGGVAVTGADQQTVGEQIARKIHANPRYADGSRFNEGAFTQAAQTSPLAPYVGRAAGQIAGQAAQATQAIGDKLNPNSPTRSFPLRRPGTGTALSNLATTPVTAAQPAIPSPVPSATPTLGTNLANPAGQASAYMPQSGWVAPDIVQATNYTKKRRRL